MDFKEFIYHDLNEFLVRPLKDYTPGKLIPVSGAAKINPMKVVNPSKPVKPYASFKPKSTSIINKKH